MKKWCGNCGNAKLDYELTDWECTLEEKYRCLSSNGDLWIERTIKATIDSEWLSNEVASIIYNQGKARLFNIVETIFEDKDREDAYKRLIENVLSDISRRASDLVKDTLVDWCAEVEFGGVCTEEEEEQALRDYEEVEKILK